jgi:hypothetical protein
MPALADGAVELPPAHLSARVPWHDTDWTGRVCAAPSANHSCTVLARISEEKIADVEDDQAGAPWAEMAEVDDVPPCVLERAGFMRPTAYFYPREHAYAGGWTRSHAQFAETTQHMPAYSVEATPFQWTRREAAADLARAWGIGFDADLEAAADQIIETRKPTIWVQDHRNQLAMLDSFFSGVVPGQSLVFLYAKDVPLLEERQPGARILIGVGRVTEVRPFVEWNYSGRTPLRSIMWERGVCHSIRPPMTDGFVLPYQQLLADPKLQGQDLAQYVAFAPAEHFDEFSYVTERVGDDAAIAALTELARVVDLLTEVVAGPWPSISAWLSDRLADAWKSRGAYPGLGVALAAAGLERGPVLAHRLLTSLDDPDGDPWPALDAAIRSETGPATGLIGRPSRRAWERIRGDDERYALLRLFARFGLTAPQARRLFAQKDRNATDAELLENPYLLFELDRLHERPVSFSVVDRGLFTQSGAARKSLAHDPLPEPVDEAADDRRVRAGSVAVLLRAADDGHTLLDEPGLRRRLAQLKLEPPCDPTDDQYDDAATTFAPVMLERPLARQGRGWQLEEAAQATALIATYVQEAAELRPNVADAPWRDLIDGAIGQPLPAADDPDHELEQLARAEKARALEILTTSRVGALVGPAGTGKTTMLKALCSDAQVAGNVLLLAPTGKARVQLGDKVGARARTLAGFLRKAERWSWERGYFLNPEGMRIGGFTTVVVDEASMLTEAMLAALLEAIRRPDRLILCGDHRQLPPIGAGRPFADLVAHLREQGHGLAELTVGRRQRPTGADSAAARDDLAVAACFASHATPAGADQSFARVLAGGGDGTLEIRSWSTEDDLHRKIVDVLSADPELGLSVRDADSLKQSLGATGVHNGRPSFIFGAGGEGAENWQLLSPVRSRPGGVVGLNAVVRKTWRPGDTVTARRKPVFPDPAGPDEVLFHDKVMCGNNHGRTAKRISTGADEHLDVANGEIGMAVGWPKKNGRGIGLWVEFSTQKDLQFTFWIDDLNTERDRADQLELAYAITVHKAQGSQFERTFVVVPKPCALLSPELLYTALTRHRQRAVLLVQGDPVELLELADPARSETARRLTCLFRPPDPFATPDGTVLDGSHVHRSERGELMRSKSELIVANALLAAGVNYEYETLLRMADGTVREPDFTIRRPGATPVYWEHLGMLDLAGYRADWKAKLQWYRDHGILPWSEGGGPEGTLVWSSERTAPGGIDEREIRELAREVF